MSDQYLEFELLKRRISELEEALRALVNQLHAVHNDKRYESVWTMYQIHGGHYTGPFYTDELAAAEKALADNG